MPPPTELGDAPININAHMIKSVVSVYKLISIVANPPLLVAVDWNNEKNKISCHSLSLKK